MGRVHKNPPAGPVKLKVHRFEGSPAKLLYRRNGRLYEHEFEAGAQILYPTDGRSFIVIKGTRVRAFLEG
jgi:hypothetical protein